MCIWSCPLMGRLFGEGGGPCVGWLCEKKLTCQIDDTV